MRPILGILVLSLALLASLVSPAASWAGDMDPLFINMTTEDSHRANMAIGYGVNQMKRGHPVTVFCNDRGVLVASSANAGKYGEHQAMLKDLAAKGATVLVCPFCMKHYGVKESDLLPGLQVSSPESTGKALFADHTKTLSW